jgi:hypothetical protein
MSKVVLSWSVQRASSSFKVDFHEDGLITHAGKPFHLSIEEALQFHHFLIAQLLKRELEKEKEPA